MKMAPVKSSEESDATMRARLVESLSHSFPGSALSKALHSMDEEMDMDPLSRSCFAELRLDIKQESETDEEELDFDEEIEEEEIDEELTSLSWLQDQDLLKNIRAGDQALCASPTEEVQKENALINGGNNHLGNPPHVPYNPQKHINSKPPYSFSCLIFMAIEDSPVKKLPVKDIYNWILTHFPYFQNAPTGWKNSVRHNLSLNKCFRKVEKEKGSSIGKGSLWMIDPDYRPNLLQALRKTPYHPYHQLQMLSSPQNNTNYTILPGNPRPPLFPQRFNINTPSPHLFPFLSRRLAQSKLETESDIDVANTLVSLKRAAENRRPLTCQNGYAVHGNRSRSPSPPEFGSEEEKQMIKRKRASRPRPVVCTSNPSSDHTYSITQEILDGCVRSPASSIDEEYEFGEQDRSRSDLDRDSFSDRNSDSSCDDEISRDLVVTDYRPRRPQKRKFVRDEDDDDDEHKKIVEGADALLNLAGIKTSLIVPLRSISPSSDAVCHNNNNLVKVKAEPEDS